MHFRVVWNEIEQNHFGLLNMLINQPTLVSPQITNVHSSRALDVQFLDAGTVTSVKARSELRNQALRNDLSATSGTVICTAWETN